MRDLDERIAEIERRSAVRIKQMRKRRIGVLMTCVPVVLCVALFMGTDIASMDNKAYAPGEALMQESEENLSVENNSANTGIEDSSENPANNVDWLLEEVQYIRTNGYAEDAKFPRIVIIGSAEELNNYYKVNKNVFDLERKETVYSDTTVSFLDACDRYDQSYFESNYLVFVLLEEGSGSVRHKVTGVEETDDGKLAVRIDRIVPEICTDDMAQWHIILEMKRDGKSIEEDQVLVEFQ